MKTHKHLTTVRVGMLPPQTIGGWRCTWERADVAEALRRARALGSLEKLDAHLYQFGPYQFNTRK